MTNSELIGIRELIYNADSYNQFEAIVTLLNSAHNNKDISDNDYYKITDLLFDVLYAFSSYKIVKGSNL